MRGATKPWGHNPRKDRQTKVKWSDDPRPKPPYTLPKYRFNDIFKGVGCAAHGDPTCLCDVIVSTETPIGPYPLAFSSIANTVHGMPNRRNFHSWASTLLGCFEAERRLVEREDVDGEYLRMPYQVGQVITGWYKLGPELREDFVWHAYHTATKFNDLAFLVPSGMSEAEVAHVRKMYNKARSDHRLNKYPTKGDPVK